MQSGGRVRRTGAGMALIPRKNSLRRLIILLAAAVLAVLVLAVFLLPGLWRRGNGLSAVSLPCYADEEVTPFGNELLYYDGSTLYCVSASGSVRWHETLGPGRSFAASDSYVVAWYGKEITVIGHNGIATYKDSMDEDVQFARVGSRYFAAITGGTTAASLVIRALDGTPVDVETENYTDKMLLDVGFYGDADQYVWSLALDVYGTAINTTLNTFQVGKMNTGMVDLGEFLTYRVIYENGRLRVFTTQQMYTYDYKAVQDVNGTQLVYGWELLNFYQPERGGAYMLLAKSDQLSASWGHNAITELRVLQDNTDHRYHLPAACVGALVRGDSIYAFSPDTLYILPLSGTGRRTFALPLPEGSQVTSFLGITQDGHALLACDLQVYAVSLPE